MSRQDRNDKKNISGRGDGPFRKKSNARGNAPLKSDLPKRTRNPQDQETDKPAQRGGYKKPFAKDKPKKVHKPKEDGLIRLNKYISNSGICSRREADTYISTGLVTVNGKVVNEMGYRVNPTDDVRFDGRRINPEPNTYILLNKPKGFATTESNAKGMTVMDLISGGTTAKVRPFGRLGRNATGLLLFTNDDEFVQKFSKKGISRLFHVELDKNLKMEHLKVIKEGLTVEGKEIAVEDVSFVDGAARNEVGLKIKHTGNSIIRTIFEHLGYDVVRVDCVTLGPLTKKDLPRGHYRTLSPNELNLFKML